MRRNPIYVFRNEDSVGVYDIPLKSTVHILNSGSFGNNGPLFLEIQGKNGLNPDSSIKEFLERPELYINLMTFGDEPTELVKIKEDGKEGWRLRGAETGSHLPIGKHALDLSAGTIGGWESFGAASGSYSMAVGLYSKALGEYSMALGQGLIAKNKNSTVFGKYNTVPNGESILEVGIGRDDFTRKNAFEIYVDGALAAPELYLDLIERSGDKTLVTKEYSDIVDGGEIATNKGMPAQPHQRGHGILDKLNRTYD